MSNYIVAIDLGSSKIAGMVAERTTDGLRIVALEEEMSVGVKRGLVIKHSEAAFCVKRIIEKLQNRIGQKIVKVYIGLGGNGLKTVVNSVSEHFTGMEELTEKNLIDLLNKNPSEIDENQVYEICNLEFLIDGEEDFNPKGSLCSHVEGKYLLVLGKKKMDENACRCLERVPTQLANIFTAPFAISEAVINSEDKELGCVVVDFGAETTSVVVYAGKCIRHMRVIPIGGKAVTKDLVDLGVVETDAEKLKLNFGYAMVSLEEKARSISLERANTTQFTVNTKDVNAIIEARMDEIMNMVCEEIYKSGYWGKLHAGMIITGGASQLRGLIDLIELKTGMTARNGDYTQKFSDIDQQFIKPEYTLLAGLLNFGTENCCVVPEEVVPDKPLEPVKPPKENRRKKNILGGLSEMLKNTLFNERDFEEPKEEAEEETESPNN